MKTGKDFDFQKALTGASSLVRQILQLTLVWSVDDCADQKGLQAKLTNITPFAQELDDIYPTDCLQADLVSAFLEDAGFVRAILADAKGKRKAAAAKWPAPGVKTWKAHLKVATLLLDNLADVTVQQVPESRETDPFETPTAPEKKRKTVTFSPEVPHAESSKSAELRAASLASTPLSVLTDKGPAPEMTAFPAGLEAVPIDLSRDEELNELVRRAMAGGEGLGAAPKATGKSTALIDNLDWVVVEI